VVDGKNGAIPNHQIIDDDGLGCLLHISTVGSHVSGTSDRTANLKYL